MIIPEFPEERRLPFRLSKENLGKLSTKRTWRFYGEKASPAEVEVLSKIIHGWGERGKRRTEVSVCQIVLADLGRHNVTTWAPPELLVLARLKGIPLGGEDGQ